MTNCCAPKVLVQALKRVTSLESHRLLNAAVEVDPFSIQDADTLFRSLIINDGFSVDDARDAYNMARRHADAS